MTADAARLDGAELELWLEEPQAGTASGFLSLREVALPADAALYLRGPLPFMKKILAKPSTAASRRPGSTTKFPVRTAGRHSDATLK
ncbi:hypothetical protein [Arthrobacter sp. D1-17]